LFSGDIGRQNKPILNDPTIFDTADYVLTESTYGDRSLDPPENMYQKLVDIVNSTVEAGGNIVITQFLRWKGLRMYSITSVKPLMLKR